MSSTNAVRARTAATVTAILFFAVLAFAAVPLQALAEEPQGGSEAAIELSQGEGDGIEVVAPEDEAPDGIPADAAALGDELGGGATADAQDDFTELLSRDHASAPAGGASGSSALELALTAQSGSDARDVSSETCLNSMAVTESVDRGEDWYPTLDMLIGRTFLKQITKNGVNTFTTVTISENTTEQNIRDGHICIDINDAGTHTKVYLDSMIPMDHNTLSLLLANQVIGPFYSNDYYGSTFQIVFKADDTIEFRLGLFYDQVFENADIQTIDISHASVSQIPSQEWTGYAIKPFVKVKLDDVELSGPFKSDGQYYNNYDYSGYIILYEDNVDEGMAKAIVQGIGAYSGRIELPFTIGNASSINRDGWVDFSNGDKGYVRNGALVKGWFDLGSSKYWFHQNGHMATGWTDVVVSDNNMRYYFNPASGNLVRNTWFAIDGKKHYFRSSGNLATGWATIADGGVDKKYYFEDDGTQVAGCWRDIDTGQGYVGRYYFRPAGSMATGWATIDGEKYWFRPSGNMATGFADVDDEYKRYFDADGHMLTGWQQIGSRTYYFRSPSGAMQTGAARIDGQVYEFSDLGVLKSPAEVVVSAVSLDYHEKSILLDTGFTLTASVSPSNAKDKTLTWTSSDPSVAMVDSGVVTAVKAGRATITATSRNGVSDSCEVTVKKWTPALVAPDVYLQMGTIGHTELGVTPGAGALSYVTADTSVASVTPDGTVIPVHVGTTTCTVSYAESDRYIEMSRTFSIHVVKGKHTLSASASDMTVSPVELSLGAVGRFPISIGEASGSLVFQKVQGASCISINASTGQVWVAKGTESGTYTASFLVTCADDDDYYAERCVLTLKVNVDFADGFGHKYWVVFNEGFREDRVEAAAFDVLSGTPYLVWDERSSKSLEVWGATVAGQISQYARVSGTWEKIGEYERASDCATQILATNMMVLDRDGGQHRRPCELPPLSGDYDGNQWWAMYENLDSNSLELVTYDAPQVQSALKWNTSLEFALTPPASFNLYRMGSAGRWTSVGSRKPDGRVIAQNVNVLVAMRGIALGRGEEVIRANSVPVYL